MNPMLNHREQFTHNPHILFYRKIDTLIPRLEKTQKKSDNWKSLSNSLLLEALLNIIVLPLKASLVVYLLFYKPNATLYEEQFSQIQSRYENHLRILGQYEIDADNLVKCTYPSRDLHCQYLFNQYEHDNDPAMFYLSTLISIQKNLLKNIENKFPVYEHGDDEMISVILVASITLIFLYFMIPKVIKRYEKNKTINVNLSIIQNQETYHNELFTLFNVVTIDDIEPLLVKLKKIKYYYFQKYYPFWQSTHKTELPINDVHRTIFSKMDELVLSNINEKRFIF